ncbi:hypothetical protein [Chryseobacterium sp. T1]
MRKEFLVVFSALTMIVACKKSDEGNKGVLELTTSETKVVTENGKSDTITTSSTNQNIDGRNMNTESIPYKALDGSRARAIFVNTEKSNTVMIEANNNKFQLDRKELTSTGAKYERNGISAEVKGDSLLISQGTTIIPLIKVK